MAVDTPETHEPSISSSHADIHPNKLSINTRMYQRYITYIFAYVHTYDVHTHTHMHGQYCLPRNVPALFAHEVNLVLSTLNEKLQYVTVMG